MYNDKKFSEREPLFIITIPRKMALTSPQLMQRLEEGIGQDVKDFLRLESYVLKITMFEMEEGPEGNDVFIINVAPSEA